MTRRVLLLLAICTILPACSMDTSSTVDRAQRSDVPDDINMRFLDPELDVDEWTARWEVESREIYASRHAIVEAVGLESGDAIADVGAGTGLFVAPFSEAVGPRGRVYALEISPRFVEHLEGRARRETLDNVLVRQSTETSTLLPRGSVDVVFLCDTYHHFAFHEAMLQSIRAALAPGGELIIIDFEREPGRSRQWILDHVRAGKRTVVNEVEAAGFRFLEEKAVGGLQENYFLRFTR